MSRFTKSPLLLLIAFYQYLISPLTLSTCRFYPTCSEYSKLALQEHGTIRGIILSFRRLIRCHPWGGCGIDLVPEKKISMTPSCKHASSNDQIIHNDRGIHDQR